MSALAAAPLHFGEPGRALFGLFHGPEASRSRRCGVVLCNPIGDDVVRAHRTFRHLAERLAAAGFPVLRFDFHGTGDSAGDERDEGRVAAWLGDVHRAIDEIRELGGVDSVALVGLRLGATLAAIAAADRDDVASIVLWTPYATGAQFANESRRLHRTHRALEPQSFAAGPAEHPDGEEALGFFLSNDTRAALEGVRLADLARRPAAAALVVGATTLDADRALASHFETLGTAVTHVARPGHPFLSAIPHRSTVPFAVLDEIVAWLAARSGPRGAERSPRPAPTRSVTAVSEDGTEEEAIVVAGQPRLFGILTRPPPARRHPSRPAVLLLNAGTVHRIGPHRQYVRMARRWAQAGLSVLRVDLSGIGDSPAAAGSDENLCYPKTALEDGGRAMDRLGRETGAERFVVAGLCSGADIAFQIALRDRRVAGVVLMNPRTFCVHDLALVEKYKDARHYQSALLRPSSWRRLARGEVDLRRALRLVAPKAKAEAARIVQRLLAFDRTDGDELPTDVPSCLRAMAERGVDTFLVAAHLDPGVDYVDVHFGAEMKRLVELPKFRRVDLAGTDHTFTSVYAQALVRETVAEHLASRHLGEEPPP